MNIALLSLPSNFHCRKWAKGLRRAGANVCVYSFEDGDAGTGIQTVKIPPPLAFHKRYFYPCYELTGKKLLRELKARRTDVLHPLHATPFGTWAVKTGFRPTVVAAIGADIFDFSPQPPPVQWQQNAAFLSAAKRNLLRPFYRKRVLAALNFADKITADNQALCNAIVEGFGVKNEKIELLRWGVDPDMFEDNREADAKINELLRPLSPPVVVVPRGLKPIYRANVILQALDRWLSKERETEGGFVLMTAGYSPDPQLYFRAKRLQAAHPNRVVLIDEQLNEREMGALWKRTDGFVSAPVYDGYSAAVAEGRYVGAVPIVDDSEAVKEWYDGENALVVAPFNAENLSKTLEVFIQNGPRLRQRFAPRNRKWITEHSLLSSSSRRFLKLCETLL